MWSSGRRRLGEELQRRRRGDLEHRDRLVAVGRLAGAEGLHQAILRN
jgi:hypothetical protein